MTNDLVSTIEAPGDFDALTKLRPGEPYFALIGRDRLAPKLVLEWAHQNRARTHAEQEAGKIDEEAVDYELRKSTQAEHVAWAMQAYKRGDPVDSPVVNRSDPEVEHYSGYSIDPATAVRDKRAADLALAVNRIHNAIASLAEASPLLEQVDRAEDAEFLTSIIDWLKEMAEELVPPRRGIPATVAVDTAQL